LTAASTANSSPPLRVLRRVHRRVPYQRALLVEAEVEKTEGVHDAIDDSEPDEPFLPF
jgi:hypothetical protein